MCDSELVLIGWHGTMPHEAITYRYTLSGHRAHNGYAGTFHYVEVPTYTDPSIVSDSTVLHPDGTPTLRVPDPQCGTEWDKTRPVPADHRAHGRRLLYRFERSDWPEHWQPGARGMATDR
jgi:hypothetical protein